MNLNRLSFFLKITVRLLVIFCFLLFGCQQSTKNKVKSKVAPNSSLKTERKTEQINTTTKEVIGLTLKEKEILSGLQKEDLVSTILAEKDLSSQLLKVRQLYTTTDSLYVEHPQLRDTIIPIFWKLCPVYHRLSNEKLIIDTARFDSIFALKWESSNEDSENVRFLKALIAQRNDSMLLTIEKAIAPIFNIKKDSVGVYNDDQWTQFDAADARLFELSPFYKTQRPPFWSGNGNFLYSEPIDSLYPKPKKMFLYSLSDKYESTVQNFGKYVDECLEYYYYGIRMSSQIRNTKDFLFASPLTCNLPMFKMKGKMLKYYKVMRIFVVIV